MTESVNELISDEAVYRTAPAPPGLLNILWSFCPSVLGLTIVKAVRQRLGNISPS